MSEDDDLWKRFAALRAPTSDPLSGIAPISGIAPTSDSDRGGKTIRDRAEVAKDEDAELERIAGTGTGAVSQNEDDILAKRIAGLKGESMKEDDLSDADVSLSVQRSMQRID